MISLKKRGQTKIMVHFMASEPLISFCFEVNQNIKRHNVGLLNVRAESIIVPHISLFIGYVDSYEMIKDVFQSVDLFAQKISPFTLDATCMFFKGVSSSALQYLSIGLLQNDFLMEQKKELHKCLQKMTYPDDSGLGKGQPYIMAGCYKNITQSIHDLVNSYNAIPSCKISQIGVSFSGEYGAYLSILKVFNL